MHVICTILASGIDLDWTDNAGKPTSKYVTHNKSNIGICFTASGYQSFSHFAALFGMPAMYISNDEGEDNMSPQVPPLTKELENKAEIVTTSSPPINNVTPWQEKFVTPDFSTNPHVIPHKEDPPLQQSDQVLFMKYHEQLGHCWFKQLKQLAEKGIIQHKLTKVPALKCPSFLYGKAHQKPWHTQRLIQN